MPKEETKGTKQEIQKTQPARAMSSFQEFERFFDDYFTRGWLHPFRHHWPKLELVKAPFEGKTPQVDIIDRDDEIIVKAELPGVDKKDLDISVTKNSVTIKGSTSQEEKEEKGDYYRSEISRGSYLRTLSLPAEVNEDKSKAKFKNGILELTLPKQEKTKRHTIKVE